LQASFSFSQNGPDRQQQPVDDWAYQPQGESKN